MANWGDAHTRVFQSTPITGSRRPSATSAAELDTTNIFVGNGREGKTRKLLQASFEADRFYAWVTNQRSYTSKIRGHADSNSPRMLRKPCEFSLTKHTAKEG